MSSSQSETSKNRGPGQNKRFWTSLLDEKLVECLLELHSQGSYRADGGFKPGYLYAVERLLVEKISGCTMKAKPHIESRLRTLKSQFTTVHDMLCGQHSSGFGWDPVNKLVTAEAPVWDAYLESHKEAASFRHRSFQHYENLSIIFGKDRATGNNAETADDVVAELDNERDQEAIDETDPMFMSVDAPNQEHSNTSSKKRKRIREANDYGQSVERAASMLSDQLSNVSSILSRSVAKEGEEEKQMRLYNELQRTTSLSSDEIDVATIILVDKPARMNVFFGVPDEKKDGWIRNLLRREGGV